MVDDDLGGSGHSAILERTALAWERTAVALIVAGALFVRGARPPYNELRHAPGIAAIMLGAVLFVFAHRRYQRRVAVPDTDPVLLVSPRAVLVTGAVVVAFSVCAVALILTGS